MSQTTRLSLVEGLKLTGNEAAWDRFYRVYGGVLLGFARRQGCDEHACMDVLQESVMVIMRKLTSFDYHAERGRFRNWLMTIVAYKVKEARRRCLQERMVSLDDPAGEESAKLSMAAFNHSAVDENVERDWRQSLLEEALRQVLADRRTNAESVAVFRAVALEGVPIAEVAKKFGLKENAIYQIKHRIMTRLQGLIVRLENGDDDFDS
ncbi:MAG: sigma-70 family RNA polymerase sigma factor [Prosthecobacter sp.]|uniref:RNA polymerase sigma factor n=1 Tax=Prosthecobacter sp. TaxID=1965333 RepID=UPI001A023292|nr:sigma-70 family RNA polymerase sigma factor [Prosthecobacter sp.]MBE2282463.1 sigma-70 family RNA polymerase sigma factor [Prosthecobacter sp.]